jgi:hypothetical protein
VPPADQPPPCTATAPGVETCELETNAFDPAIPVLNVPVDESERSACIRASWAAQGDEAITPTAGGWFKLTGTEAVFVGPVQ